MQQDRRINFSRLPSEIGLPVAGLSLFSVFFIIFLLFYAAHGENKVAAAAASHLAESALRAVQTELRRVTHDYAHSDVTMESLDGIPNTQWADTVLRDEVLPNYNITTVLVVGGDNGMAYGASRDATMVLPRKLGELAGDLRGLVFKARGEANSQPSLTGLARIDGRPHVVAVAPVQWFSPDRPHLDRTPTVLIFGRQIDDPLLADIARDYLLKGLAYTSAPEVALNEISLKLTAPDGSVLGHLVMNPDLPGATMMQTLLLPVAVAVGVIGTLLLIVVHRAQRASQAFEALVAQRLGVDG